MPRIIAALSTEEWTCSDAYRRNLFGRGGAELAASAHAAAIPSSRIRRSGTASLAAAIAQRVEIDAVS